MEEHIEAVQRMQDYIEAHLDANISMADLANVAKEENRKIMLCHVLRYTPYYRKIKETISKHKRRFIISFHRLFWKASYLRGRL